MAESIILTPVSEDDPCGPDLRWDADFLNLQDAFTKSVSSGAVSVVDAEVVAVEATTFDEVVAMAAALMARTKDLRVLAMHAEAAWYAGGLVAFASAMEDLVGALETWPAPDVGIHPRADEFDGDLGERAGAVGALLNKVPSIAATAGWGAASGAEKVASAALLRGVFGAWTTRVEEAFGPDTPSAMDAWKSLQPLVGGLEPGGEEPEEEGGAVPTVGAVQTVDAWDLIDRAVEQMSVQDHHSPALPLLRLLATWRALGIVEIVDKMKTSGVTLEQLMESVKRQTQIQ